MLDRKSHPSPHQALAASSSGPEPGAVPGGRAALVVAHPGHELRVYGWVERARPLVCVLTDGSGPSGAPRLAWTDRLLARAGARPGSIYGRLSDRAFYEALIDHDHALFEGLAGELCEALVDGGIDYVVGDLDDGHNPAHDVCRCLLDVAVARLRGRGAPMRNFDFVLVGPPDARPEGASDTVALRCDRETLARKREAALAYLPLAAEVRPALALLGEEGLRTEILRARPAMPPARGPRAPDYERHGSERVAAGRYAHVLRYREHVQPLERRLAAWGRGA